MRVDHERMRMQDLKIVVTKSILNTGNVLAIYYSMSTKNLMVMYFKMVMYCIG